MPKYYALMIAVSALLAWTVTSQAEVVVTADQVGNNVVFTGGGTINLDELTSLTPQSTAPGVQPNGPAWGVGSLVNPDIEVFFVTNVGSVSGPSSFGPGSTRIDADLGSGDVFGIGTQGPFTAIALPLGYSSGDPLNGTATYENTTLAGLGMELGTYTWFWDTGGNGDSITLNVIPEPASLTLLGLSSLALLRRR